MKDSSGTAAGAPSRGSITIPILVSAISNIVVGLIWLASLVGFMFTIPIVILCIFEFNLHAKAHRLSIRVLAQKAERLGTYEIIVGLANPVALVCGILVLVNASRCKRAADAPVGPNGSSLEPAMPSTQDTSIPEKHGCRTLVALSFIAVMWILLTLLAAARACIVGWPALVTDQIVIPFSAISLILLVLVVVGRNEIIKGGITACPKCGEMATMGGFRPWQFIVMVFFFPVGLLAMMAGREPTKCPKCDHSWQA